MHFGIDPTTGSRVTAVVFQRLYGTTTTDELTPQPAECPYCKQHLYLRQGAKNLHFWHGTASGFCPSKAPFGQPTMGLKPNNSDAESGANLRALFKAHWQLHYQELARLIPAMSFDEFLMLLEQALSRNMFAYRGMAIEDVPYVLVLAHDYPPATGMKQKGVLRRKYWFRFWYDMTVNRIDDLWSGGAANVALTRASFTPPVAPKKFPDHDADLVKDTAILRTPFLDAALPNLPSFVVTAVDQWFTKHPAF